MKNEINKNAVRRVVSSVIAATAAMSCAVIASAAADLQGSVIYTGTAKLISDITGIFTILCPTICGLFAIVFAIRRGMADEQDGKIWNRRIITAVACGVAGGLISGLISLIANYYK